MPYNHNMEIKKGTKMLALKDAKKLCKMDPRTTAKWYAKGYYMKEDGLWYSMHGGREFVKYYTGS